MTILPVKEESGMKVEGLFENVVFALALGAASFETKSTLRKKITANGGVISYLVTSKCHFLITNEEGSTSTLTSERAASKHGIPLVNPAYVDACLAAGTVLPVQQQSDVGRIKLLEKVEREFSKGNILAEEKETRTLSRPAKFSSAVAKLKAWEFLDASGPQFHHKEYTVAKFSCLQGRPLPNGETPFCVLEIHVLANHQDEDKEYRFCVYQHLESGGHRLENQNKKSVSTKGSSQRLCRFTDSSTAALQTFENLYDMLSNPLHSMSKWDRRTPLPMLLGSPQFRSTRERWSAALGQLEAPVVQLVERAWEAAIGCLDKLLLLPRPIRLSAAQLNTCQSLLLQMRSHLIRGDQEAVQRLADDYFQLLPQHDQRPPNSGKDLVRQQELLQLVRDVVTMSEPLVGLHLNDDEEKDDTMSTAAKYLTLNCSVSHLEVGSEEYAAVAEKVTGLDAASVRIRNAFAVRRPDEEIAFDHELYNRRILFHASPVSNFVGILSRGLLLPKVICEEKGVEALGPGDLGAGIYFSDSPAASLRYCGESGGSGGPRLMLLAQVALGSTFTVETGRMPELTAAPEGHHSVCRVSSASIDGQAKSSTEYAIYCTEQQRLVYLIELEPEAEDAPAPIRELKMRASKFVADKEVDAFASDSSQRKVFRDALEDILAEKDHANAVPWGLRGGGNEAMPVASVHVRVEITDLAAKVVIMQEYSNASESTVQAKYLFPLDELSAVCGFEAFIDGKHVIGEVREKESARQEYRQAVSEGHGAYLMDEIAADTFSVSVGNLPPRARVLIKITYVTELTTDGEKILFRLPGFAARKPASDATPRLPFQLKEENEIVTTGEGIATYSFEAAVSMPFAIRAITSHTHRIVLKKTETMATVRLQAGQQLAQELRILIDLAEIHVPRMWVERAEGLPEACMLTFFPSFDSQEAEKGTLTILLDASNSMRGDAFRDAQCLALLCLRFLSNDWTFNVVLFGSTYDELFPVARIKSQENLVLAETFVTEASPTLGCTDANQVLRPFYLLPATGPHATHSVLLVSDGHLNNPGALLSWMRHDLEHDHSGTRLFTLGVGTDSSPCNRHLLKLLADRGSGACEYFDCKSKWGWAAKIRDQLRRCAQPTLTDVRVEWQQLDERPESVVQAPSRVSPLFQGTRQVVYGFVPRCSLATLSARVGHARISTVVSCAELSKSAGRTLHLLTAKAVIRDWEAGLLEEDAAKNDARKSASKDYIISLSKQYGLVSSLTSYIAVEKRDKEEGAHDGPSIEELVNREDVDQLQYIQFEDTDVGVTWGVLKRTHPDEEVPAPTETHAETVALFKRKQCSKRKVSHTETLPGFLSEKWDIDEQVKMILENNVKSMSTRSCTISPMQSLLSFGGYQAAKPVAQPAAEFPETGVAHVFCARKSPSLVNAFRKSPPPPFPDKQVVMFRKGAPRHKLLHHSKILQVADSSADTPQQESPAIDLQRSMTGLSRHTRGLFQTDAYCLGSEDDPQIIKTPSVPSGLFGSSTTQANDPASFNLREKTLFSNFNSGNTPLRWNLADETANSNMQSKQLPGSPQANSTNAISFNSCNQAMSTSSGGMASSILFGGVAKGAHAAPIPAVAYSYCDAAPPPPPRFAYSMPTPPPLPSGTAFCSPLIGRAMATDTRYSPTSPSYAKSDRCPVISRRMYCMSSDQSDIQERQAKISVFENGSADGMDLFLEEEYERLNAATPTQSEAALSLVRDRSRGRSPGMRRHRRFFIPSSASSEEEGSDSDSNADNLSGFFVRYNLAAAERSVNSSPNQFSSSLPICNAIIEQLLSSSCQFLPTDAKLLLKKGTGDTVKASDLGHVQTQLTTFETPSPNSTTTDLESCIQWAAILNEQDQLGNFTIKSIDLWKKKPKITAHLLGTLESAGIKSLGAMQMTTIIQLCATLFVVLSLLFEADITESSAADVQIFSRLSRFSSVQLVQLTRALAFARWADKQTRLSCRLLELGSNWEAFVWPFVRCCTTTPLENN